MKCTCSWQEKTRETDEQQTDQGQGAGQAIEDAASLSVVLPIGTSPEAVPERLKLYEKIRYKRAHTIQEYSRQAGKDWVDGKPQVKSKSLQFTTYSLVYVVVLTRFPLQ